MEKIIPFRTSGPSYDILADTAGCLAEDVFNRYNIKITKTAVNNTEDAADLFRPSLEAGKDILYICTFGIDTAKKAAAELLAAYPGRHIVCVDMLSDSEDDSLKTVKMSWLRAAGATLAEAASFYKNHRQPSPVSFPAVCYN